MPRQDRQLRDGLNGIFFKTNNISVWAKRHHYRFFQVYPITWKAAKTLGKEVSGLGTNNNMSSAYNAILCFCIYLEYILISLPNKACLIWLDKFRDCIFSSFCKNFLEDFTVNINEADRSISATFIRWFAFFIYWNNIYCSCSLRQPLFWERVNILVKKLDIFAPNFLQKSRPYHPSLQLSHSVKN